MTSVNSPACLLARNHFYKNTGSSPEPSPAVLEQSQNNSMRHKQKQVTLWVTMETPPGVIGTKGLQASILLGFYSSLPFSTSKPTSPTGRDVK